METPEELLKLGLPDPEQMAVIEKQGPLPMPDFNDVASIREGSFLRARKTRELLGSAEQYCSETTINIPLRDASQCSASLWRPTKSPAEGSPLFVLFFAGGFVFGNPKSLLLNARVLCRQYGATVLAPVYRLGPENPFPAAPHDAWDTTRWAAEHAAELGADVNAGFVVGGVSAGANLATVVGTQWVTGGYTPSITGLWLAVPPLFRKVTQVPDALRHLYLSEEQNTDSPVLHKREALEMRKRYRGDPDSPLYAPALCLDAIPRMPPVYFQVCGMDPLRDDAIIYDKMLREAGRKTMLHMYPGMVHAGWIYFPNTSLAEQSRLDFVVGAGWLLGQPPREDPVSRAGWENMPLPGLSST